MVVESGPVEYADQEHDVDDDDDEDVHLSAARLMGQEYGPGEFCGTLRSLKGSVSPVERVYLIAKIYIVLFVETPRKFITAKLSIRKPKLIGQN